MTARKEDIIQEIQSQVLTTVEKSVTETIERVVNGKINKMGIKVAEHDEKLDKLGEKMDTLIEQFKPVNAVYNNATGFGRTIMGISVFFGSMGGLVTAAAVIWSYLHPSTLR